MGIGKEYSPILVQIEDGLIDTVALKPNYTTDGFRAAVYIFQSAMFDKMIDLQEKENMSDEDCELMAKNLGEELRNFIGRCTGIDTHKLFNNESAEI
jgi:hypothetical protein